MKYFNILAIIFLMTFSLSAFATEYGYNLNEICSNECEKVINNKNCTINPKSTVLYKESICHVREKYRLDEISAKIITITFILAILLIAFFNKNLR